MTQAFIVSFLEKYCFKKNQQHVLLFAYSIYFSLNYNLFLHQQLFTLFLVLDLKSYQIGIEIYSYNLAWESLLLEIQFVDIFFGLSGRDLQIFLMTLCLQFSFQIP
eukprot:TRINITY_DN13966_c2_g1_i1.p4 TRINITY_DN13966_c2_g1~~TRINITY_DN13966_c2_g1_i1.p4  ORF type:complete len:106 (-),score=0.12 TRINITY_DN13966_c2_g1_i1:359-676(-)